MLRFLRYKTEDAEELVRWMGSVMDIREIQDPNGVVIEEITDLRQFETVKTEKGYLGIMLVVTEEVENG